MFDIREELKKLPDKPGVYLMKDKHGEIIYIGKARILKNRVRQYFQGGRNKSAKILKMISLIDSFEYIITDSELEALILECNLIKEYSPKYNTMLKDDKTYPYIKVTTAESFPRLIYTRSMKKDKSKYFGPYTAATAVKETIELLRKMYKIRPCNKLLKEHGNDVPYCLYYHIKQCDAPCQNMVSVDEYKKGVDKALTFLSGRYDELLSELTSKMYEYSENLEFEKAGEYKALIDSVNQIAQKQKITGNDSEDRDIIAVASDNMVAVAQVFFVRDGKLIGRDHFYLKNVHDSSIPEIVSDFIKQFYQGSPFVPKSVMLQTPIKDMDLMAEWLSGIRGSRTQLLSPKYGEKEKLVELAYKNARLVLNIDKERLKAEEAINTGAVNRLAAILNITGLNRIEAYDISHISGFETVGAMIVYEHGVFKKNAYRKFKIRSVTAPDDYASMYETLKRRLSHIDDADFGTAPDLILMDGGKGQVNIALRVIKELGLNIKVCGMVKDDKHRTAGLYYNNEEIVATNKEEDLMKLLTRIQDEVHRFAITYHRLRRGKEQIHSILDDISGIGASRRLALMKRFESIEAIRDASIDELSDTDGMNKRVAKAVYEFFHSQK